MTAAGKPKRQTKGPRRRQSKRKARPQDFRIGRVRLPHRGTADERLFDYVRELLTDAGVFVDFLDKRDEHGPTVAMTTACTHVSEAEEASKLVAFILRVAWKRTSLLASGFDQQPEPLAHPVESDWSLLSIDKLRDTARRVDQVSGDMELLRCFGRRADREDGNATVELLIDGLIPRGGTTLLVGPPSVGKSTLTTEIAVAVASGSLGVVGLSIDLWRPTPTAVILSGEDSNALLNDRLRLLDPDDQAKRLAVLTANWKLPRAIESSMRLDTDLLVVDPARSFLQGDEDSSQNVNDLFKQLDTFAQKANAAIILVHHLLRREEPKSAAEILRAIRGSQAWVDRPRVVLGLYRSAGQSILCSAKNNLPPNVEVVPEIALRRDPETLRHVPVTGEDGTGSLADQARKLRDEGASEREIARRLEVSRWKISRWLAGG